MPKVDIFDAQVSLVNVLRERVQNGQNLEDRTLIALGIEWSTFTQEELTRILPALRATPLQQTHRPAEPDEYACSPA